MKFTFEAVNEQGDRGMLTLIRRGRVMEYWSFELTTTVYTTVVQPTVEEVTKWDSTSAP